MGNRSRRRMQVKVRINKKKPTLLHVVKYEGKSYYFNKLEEAQNKLKELKGE